MNQEAKVELYNYLDGGRVVGNGWLVGKYIDGCRADTLQTFGTDEQAARNFCERWNNRCEACLVSPHPGVLIMSGNPDPLEVQRCDECGLYKYDEDAANALRGRGVRVDEIEPEPEEEDEETRPYLSVDPTSFKKVFGIEP